MAENCSCHETSKLSAVSQTLDEMEFERGIWSAALDGDKARVEEFLRKGVSPNTYDAAGYTALHYAARSGHFSVCKLLIKAGADINAVTRAGQATALHRAISAGKEEVVSFLLKSNADVEMQDNDGSTCLHRAVIRGNEKIIKMLLEVCPNLQSIADLKGKLPKDYISADSRLPTS